MTFGDPSPAVSTAGEAATGELATALAPLLSGGDVLVLTGELGTGKTVFVKALAAAMGVDERVTSPTFTMVHTYEGQLTFHHLDAYRVGESAEVSVLGLSELIAPDAVVVAEWGERIASELPGDRLEITLTRDETVDGATELRRFVFRPLGPSWSARRRRLEVVVAAVGAKSPVDMTDGATGGGVTDGIEENGPAAC